MRARNPKSSEGGCFEAASGLALAHNNALNAVLTSLGQLLKGFKYCNSEFYTWLYDRINNPASYGMCALLDWSSVVQNLFQKSNVGSIAI